MKRGDLRKVLGRIRRNGPLTIRDIDDDVLVEKDHEWASRKPSKRALQLAFYRGVLTVSRREGMLKTYELTTRHFGWDRLPKAALGDASGSPICSTARCDRRAWSASTRSAISTRRARRRSARLIGARVRRKELVPVALEGARLEHWATPEALDTALEPGRDIVHILNPFDPLVIQRKRLAAFFDYEHRFEAYVPKEKRRLRLFRAAGAGRATRSSRCSISRPIASGKAAGAEMDLAAEGPRGALRRQIEEALHRFERFQLAR